jgi:hypothetical protein
MIYKKTAVFLFLLLLFTGCGKKALSPIDLQAFSSDMLGSGAFTEQLTAVDPDIGSSFYNIPEADFTQALFFFSSGATAEELALFEAVDEEAALRIKAAVENRIAAQKIAFESYVPAEVPKLDKAVVYTRGTTVILYVADLYDAAKAVLDQY